MNTRRFRPRAGSVSLFPFLAVLICTMGALIVLLVVLVQQSKDALKQPPPAEMAEAEPAPPADPAEPGQLSPEEQLTDVRWQLETLQSSREATKKQLQDAQLRLSMTEDQIRDLSQELDRLERRAQQIEAVRAQQLADRSQQEQKLQELQATVARTAQELIAAREQAAQRKPRYSIIPFSGVHGTDRRPVFVECLSDRVVLQPEGIELFPSDFAHADQPDNPLAAAIRAAREYWLDNRVLNTAAAAYPLLIVRPQGVDAYHGCRAALDGWDDEFGYELIPADVELQYSPPDPTLRAAMLDAIADARVRGHLPTPTARGTASAGSFVPGDSSAAGGEFGASAGGSAGDGAGDGSGWQSPPSAFQPVGTSPVNDGEPQTPGNPGGAGDSASGDESTFAPATSGSNPTGGGAPARGDSPNSPGGPDASPGGANAGNAAAGGGSGFSFADERGANWALPSSAEASIGTSRPVAIAIQAGQLRLAAEAGSPESPQSFPFRVSIKEAIPTFVDALWSRIETWGVAGPSAYWKPTLLVDVTPDGEAAYHEFVQLMKRSGLTIERRSGQ